MQTANGTNYGNWVPRKMIGLLFGVGAALAALTAVGLLLKSPAMAVIFGILAALALAYGVYMRACYRCFSFEGGGLMKKIHKFVVDRLLWDGKGQLLDIGCGSGAMTIRCARKFPNAKCVGLDYWGHTWDYAKSVCEENARLEDVENVEFLQGDATKLPFEDGSFDAAVSNFVFHEVRTAKDKKELVREALRVVRKGGSFAFQDMFQQKQLYGDMHEFIKELKAQGVSEIYYEPNTEDAPFIPGFTRSPMMLHNMGILFGIK